MIIKTVCFCLMPFLSYVVKEVQGKVEITRMSITSNVSVRFAEVSVSSTVVNNEGDGEETSFEMRMPKAAFITSFKILLNGEEFKGEIRENKEAKEIYADAKKQNLATGLITRQASVQKDLDYELFKVEVFIPAGSLAEFYLQYQELLERRLGAYSQRLFVRPKQIVPDFKVVCYYMEPQGFMSFEYKIPTADMSEVSTEFTDFTRKINYSPSAQSQMSEDPILGLDDQLTVDYDVIHDTGGGIVVESEDHFTHFFSPECQDDMILNKRIVFVVDKSGSMKSPRIDYVKTALKSILGQLRPSDYFNVITFEKNINIWRSVLVEASANNIRNAIQYIETITASGGTNINTGLLQGIRMFKSRQLPLRDDEKSNIIVFLTDGKATEGVTNSIEIRKQVAAENILNNGKLYASIFSLAFGKDTNEDLLQQIAWSNGGAYTAISTDEEASSLLLNFFEGFQDPYLNDVRFDYNGDTDELLPITLTRTNFPQYFCGSELVVSGMIDESLAEQDQLDEEETANDLSSSPIFGFQPRVYAKNNKDNVEFVANRRITYTKPESKDFLSRLYVYSKIRDLLKEAAVESGIDDTTKAELHAQALNLSLTYGFVTELTSMVVRSVKADEVRVSNRMGKVFDAGIQTRQLGNSQMNFPLYEDQSTTGVSTEVDRRLGNGGQQNYKTTIHRMISLSICFLLAFLLHG